MGPMTRAAKQVLKFVAGQRDQPVWWRVLGAFGGGQDGEEGVGEHGEGDPAVPGTPAADLVLIQPGEALAGLEGLLHGPAAPGDPDQVASGTGRGA